MLANFTVTGAWWAAAVAAAVVAAIAAAQAAVAPIAAGWPRQARCKLAVPRQRPCNGHVLVWVVWAEARSGAPHIPCTVQGQHNEA